MRHALNYPTMNTPIKDRPRWRRWLKRTAQGGGLFCVAGAVAILRPVDRDPWAQTAPAVHARTDAAAMQRALAALAIPPTALLIDALALPDLAVPQRAIIRGDQQSLSIACASILAKVARDRMMIGLDGELLGYAFGQHKGYGTAQHRAALEKLGASAAHRTSFAPIRNLPQGLVLAGG